MYAEEQFLRRKFGNTYTDWAENVPAFIPSLPHFKKPNLPFSWRKVVKKEKNGLAAIFVIFFLFEVLGESISENYEFNYFYIYACVATLLMYFVLKIIKMKTTWLDEAGR
jgi:protein-S-isoprenylcysteine O-methyltransferase Ste14